MARASLSVLVAGALVQACPAAAQFLRQDVWQPDGPVYAMATVGSTLYVGGAFGSVRLPVGEFAELDAMTGRIHERNATLNGGKVNAVASDGAGGWYLGGYGLSGGRNLVHMLPDRSLSHASG